MEQYTDNQYDDDLTIGADDFGDAFQTSDVDLFEFGGDEESPISRLKTLVLSIDWEITDDVLVQFNEELGELKNVWADDKVRMVYLQALEKISRYIYREKSDANPNAIKLLLGMYYNLEKIVSAEDLSEREIKRILLKDVRKFEKLKSEITQGDPVQAETLSGAVAEDLPETPPPLDEFDPDQDDHELMDLKALVLGIDWEITEKDLLELREEVMRLEGRFSGSKPKLVFLQGIGTLATYILKKKSNAHVDAFTLLHSFYDGFERIVLKPMSLDEEKAVLLPEVEKFYDFKELIAPTIASGVQEKSDEDDEGLEYEGGGEVAPAFADMPEDETHGFQEEEEAALLSTEAAGQVGEHVNKFFGEEGDQPVPSLGAAEGDTGEMSVEEQAEALSNAFFTGDEAAETPMLEIDRDLALQGVDVETEADDDSDEEALPEFDGEVAPALAGSLDESSYSADQLDRVTGEELPEEVTDKLDNFFGDSGSDESATAVGGAAAVPAEVALQGVDVETDADEEDESDEPVSTQPFGEDTPVASEFAASGEAEADEAPVAALFDEVFEDGGAEAGPAATDDEPVAALSGGSAGDDADVEDALPEGGLFGDDDTIMEESFEEVLSAPVEEEEIASALSGYEELGGDDLEAVPAALVHVDEAANTLEADAESEEAEVAERFDALFGEAELEQEEEEEVASVFDDSWEESPAALSEDAAAPALAGAAAAAGAAALAGSLEEADEDEYAAVFTAAEEEGDLTPGETVDADEPAGEGFADDKALSPLKECVHSLALDLDDSVVQGLFHEINSLRQQWAEKPFEKSYLQLLSTVAQHIDQYRYEASADSHGLLDTLVGNLEASRAMSADKAQENLLADTYHLLQWQQDMLKRQAVSRGGQLTFLDPVRSDGEDDGQAKVELSDDTFADDFAAELESSMRDDDAGVEMEEGEFFIDSLDDEIDTFIPEGDETVDLELEEALTREVEQAEKSFAGEAGGDGGVTEVVRREIDSLRKLLQTEIAELRKAIKGDSE